MISEDKYKVSVVIAHYNGGEYVRQNLENLVNQTLADDEYEVIIVDDKSTESLNIIKEYEDKIKNFTLLVENKNNGYPSIPRNHGIDIAQGTFIMIIDQDDYIAENTLEKFIEFAGDDSDVIVGKYKVGEGFGGTQAPFKKGNIKHADIVSDNLMSSLAPHKMYRKDFLNKYDIRFLSHEYVPVGEDQVFNLKAYSNARNISIMSDQDYYFWCKRDDAGNLGKSSRYDFNTPEKFLNLGMESIKAIEDSDKFSKGYKDKIIALYVGRFFNSRGTLFKTLKLMGTDEKRAELLKRLKEELVDRMSQEAIYEVRDKQNYVVNAIKYNTSYKDLLKLRDDIYYNTSLLNVSIDDNGRLVRRVVVNDNKFDAPVDFLNKVKPRVYSSRFVGAVEIIDTGLEADFYPTGMELSLEIVSRSDKNKIIEILPDNELVANRAIFSIDYKNILQNSKYMDDVYDVFLVSAYRSKTKKYRLGQNRNGLTCQIKKINIQDMIVRVFYTKYENISIEIKKK